MRFEADAANLLLSAAGIARDMGHSYVGSVHLFLALSEQPGKPGVFLRCNGLTTALIRDVAAAIYGKGTPDLPLPQGLTDRTGCILRAATVEAKRLDSRTVA